MTPILTFLPIQLRSLYTTLLQPKSFNHIMASTNHDSNTLVLIDIFLLSPFNLLPFYSPLLLQIVTQVAAQSPIAISLFLFTFPLSTTQLKVHHPLCRWTQPASPAATSPSTSPVSQGMLELSDSFSPDPQSYSRWRKPARILDHVAKSGRNIEYDIIM